MNNCLNQKVKCINVKSSFRSFRSFQAMVLPEDAGFPLGGPDYSRYVLLEVHYNNPDNKAGTY